MTLLVEVRGSHLLVFLDVFIQASGVSKRTKGN